MAELSESRRGAWIINASKHLQRFDSTSIGLTSLENLAFAGKCGSLLIKLSADKVEQLTVGKVSAHCRATGISKIEEPTYLNTLAAIGSLDVNSAKSTYEVLAASRQRVLATTNRILASSAGGMIETLLPDVLERCLSRPRLESELMTFLTKKLSEADAAHCISLLMTFQLVGVVGGGNGEERLFFNGHRFGRRSDDLAKALRALSPQEREEVDKMLNAVASMPGKLPESLSVPEKIQNFVIGLGLVDVSEVASPAGTARFLTLPGLGAPSVGGEADHLEDDVFHHAKMLLSSFRFGELRSTRGRGKIWGPDLIVNALLTRDRVGPCTAIGQDYVILETEGVIRTVRATNKPGDQRYMELRRREPAEIVQSLVTNGSTSAIDSRAIPQSLLLPNSYSGPESAQPPALAKVSGRSPEILRKFLQQIRT